MRKNEKTWTYFEELEPFQLHQFVQVPLVKKSYGGDLVSKVPFIPRESEINQLIDACSVSSAAFLRIIMETGGNASSEIIHLKWADIDSQNHTVKITNAENSQTRITTVSAKTIVMINSMPRQQGDYLFSQSIASFRKEVDRAKKKLTKTLQNPRFSQINFRSIRHWKGVTEYLKTRDILNIQRLLGMRNIRSALRYISLIDDVEGSDETPSTNVKCPNCGSGPRNLPKNGTYAARDGSKKRRWHCNNCGQRFTYGPNNPQSEKTQGGKN